MREFEGGCGGVREGGRVWGCERGREGVLKLVKH